MTLLPYTLTRTPTLTGVRAHSSSLLITRLTLTLTLTLTRWTGVGGRSAHSTVNAKQGGGKPHPPFKPCQTAPTVSLTVN